MYQLSMCGLKIMAKDRKVNMPQSGAGILTNFGETGSKIKVKPEYVVAGIIIIIILMILLHMLVPI